MALDVTGAQLGLFMLWMATCLVTVVFELMLAFKPGFSARYAPVPTKDEEAAGEQKEEDQKPKKREAPPPITTRRLLHCLVVFGAIMFYMFECEIADRFPEGARVYNRDLFLFINLSLLGTFALFSKPLPKSIILGREQTEEWKGWMQCMFVFYHYFAAAETYNLIRVYIAAYVWMTGFGNFSYFWVRGDYSIQRLLKMLFRLNFLVFFVCIVTENEYMLYYICPMHTFWFLFVYAFMRIGVDMNKDPRKMMYKFIAAFVFLVLVYEVPNVGNIVFWPLSPILNYEGKGLYEWMFRSGLDHYATFIGMLCAYNYPRMEALMHRVEDSANKLFRNGTKFLIFSIFAAILAVWYMYIGRLEKYTYNVYHPYTSFIPLICYIVLRNVSKTLRAWYIFPLAWLGKITLETYLCQLHIYMQANAKKLIVYIPDYPLMNFVFATVVYTLLSWALFRITNELSAWLFESTEPRKLSLRLGGAVAILLAFIGVGLLIIH
eukprot:Colp12_sorted_trinity150504_noHs@35039